MALPLPRGTSAFETGTSSLYDNNGREAEWAKLAESCRSALRGRDAEADIAAVLDFRGNAWEPTVGVRLATAGIGSAFTARELRRVRETTRVTRNCSRERFRIGST